jgi:hypothetical protein
MHARCTRDSTAHHPLNALAQILFAEACWMRDGHLPLTG